MFRDCSSEVREGGIEDGGGVTEVRVRAGRRERDKYAETMRENGDGKRGSRDKGRQGDER